MLAGDDVAFAAAGAAGQPARRRPRLGLAPKLVLAFIGLVSFVLVVNGSIDLWLAYREAENAAIRMQQEDAREAAQRIAHVVDDVEEQLGWTTPPGWDALALEQRRYDFIRLLREVPAISEVTEIDGSGKEMLKVSRLAPDVVASGADDAAQPRFADAKANGVWFSPIYFRNHSEPYMTIAVAHAGHDAGVTAANVRSAVHLGSDQDDAGRPDRICLCGRFARPADRPSRPQPGVARDRSVASAAGRRGAWPACAGMPRRAVLILPRAPPASRC